VHQRTVNTMSDVHPCEHVCALAATCSERAQCAAATPISLADTLDRLEREAVRGVCDTGRYRCNYYSWGDGPPLVFIPGLSDSSHAFVLPIGRLSAHFRCIAYDLPIGGGDGAVMARYTHEHLVQDFFALLDHLRIRQSYVFGSSFGSTIALAALRCQPDRLRRGILQGGFAHRPLRRGELWLARLGQRWPGSMRLLPFRMSVMRHIHQGPFAGREPAVWDYFAHYTGQVPVHGVAYQALLIHHTDLRPLLAEVQQPVLLVTGAADPVVPRVCSDLLLQHLPSAGRVEIDGCGHLPYFTHPELLAEVMRRFLTPPTPLAASPPVCQAVSG
jgi:pimeloyl-ACP methyl ester carboxylesterase